MQMWNGEDAEENRRDEQYRREKETDEDREFILRDEIEGIVEWERGRGGRQLL